MKIPALVLACTFALPTAYAQSSVTLFGVVDAAISRYRGEGTGSLGFLSSGNMASGRIGVRGVEDLGGGLAASFWLEAGTSTDDGRGFATNTNNQAPGGAPPGQAGGQGLTFNRRSTVSVSGAFGELRLGRDYTPTFWNLSVFDPFGVLGVAQIGHFGVVNATLSAVRASNSIGYFTPGCNAAAGCPGFYGQVMYALGENQSGTPSESDGRYFGVRVGYNHGPVQAAAAFSRSKSVAADDFRQANVGAGYDAGFAKFTALYADNRTGRRGGAIAGVSKARYVMLASTVRMTPNQDIRISYAQLRLDNSNGSRADQLGVGTVYHLSKRTSLYGFYARIDNRRGVAGSPRIALTGGPAVTALNGSASGFDVGVRHAF